MVRLASIRLKTLRWGAFSLIMLLLSIASGLLLALQYDYNAAWYSSVAIELLAPFGSFFRSLHFYSSQLFFLFTLCHFVAVYYKTERYGIIEWLRLMATFPTIIMLLFGGYVLRGDITGTSAGQIAENIALSIPFIGYWFNSFLFDLEQSGLRKVYVHHVISFDLLLLLLIWRHLHIYRVKIQKYTALVIATCAICILFTAPLEPEDISVNYISGPWFFLGLQELLRYFPPAIAGVVVPLVLLATLFTIHPRSWIASLGRKIIYVWFFCYAFLSVIAIFRS